MNFALIHFIVKLVFGYGSLAVHILAVHIQEENESKWNFISNKTRDTYETMDQQTENKQSEKGHKGVSQRKSYVNMAEREQHEKSEVKQAVEMSRQSSKTSINTSSVPIEGIASKEINTKDNKIPGQPINFGAVSPGIYRSSYPQEADYPFLLKLGLKTIM